MMAYCSMRPNGAVEIWTGKLDGSAAQPLTRGGRSSLLEWSRDGQRLAYLSIPDSTVNIIPSGGGKPKAVGKSLSRPVWSPDGKRIGLVTGEEESGHVELVIASLVDGSRQALRSTLTTNMPGGLWFAFNFDWSPDGRQIVWPVLVEGRMRLALIDASADRVVKILPTDGFARDPRFSPDGRWIAYASESSGHPSGIRVISTEGSDDHPVTRPTTFAQGEFVKYPSTGGLRIPSFLFRPAAEAKTRRPAIVWLHGGGGVGSTLDKFDRGIQYFVTNGFVILAPNYRTSRGFGPELVVGATGKDLADDVAAAAAYLKTLNDVDGDRIGVFGASFGGYAVLQAITKFLSVFAVAVDINGPCELSSVYREVPLHRPIMRTLLGGSPEEVGDRYREESPLHYADRITAPLLVIHGTVDETVPYKQSEILAAALQKAGKKHKFLTYQGMGHGFPPVAWANVMQNAMAFFKQELQSVRTDLSR
jgi:dipeptidyl aminopeptidase/acylaminoacyl peptidase